MSESGGRAGRRGGRRGRGRGRGGGAPNAACHGRYVMGLNGGPISGGTDGSYADGGHVQQDWTNYNANKSAGTYVGNRGRSVDGPPGRNNNGHGGGHDVRSRNLEGGYSDGVRSRGTGYSGGGAGHYTSEREEGRARALEELRGVFAEQDHQQSHQQGHHHERRRRQDQSRGGNGYGQDWENRRGNINWQNEGHHAMGARRGGGNSRRADDYMREENGYHHGPPESEMNQQDYNQHPNRQDGRDFQQRVNSYENGRRWKRQDDRRGGHRATEGEKVADVASSDMRGRISAQLARGVAECLVCLDRVKQVTPTWDCHSCFQVFHLSCIKKWAKSAVETSGGWRCPGCQGVNSVVPTEYRCFCRKQRNPEWNRNENLVPHSCGELCGKERAAGCPHRCAELCHPGRCPPCTATVMAKCPCGRDSKRQKCGEPLICSSTCDKPLPCGRHTCQLGCHEGPCMPCAVTITQICHCAASSREIPCTADAELVFSCGDPCPQTLDCGLHPCTSPCHPGPCPRCTLAVAQVTHCPCGQTALESLYQTGATPRTNCLDPIPVCTERCQKPLSCGPPSAPHACPNPCHTGPCPPCPLVTLVKCRCGHMDKEMPCIELTTRADDARCGKQCKSKRSCGRHKCGEHCCILLEHPCPLTCGQLLSCGLHRCEEPCHRGKCPKCPYVSFDELSCRCGAAVIFPPVACGVRPPECSRICSLLHACDHPITHNCHSEEHCPPCTTLTVKTCYGGHEQRKNLACHIDGISCGKPCGARMPCGQHTCQRTCHAGPCATSCSQPCKVVRPCNHPCLAPCHPNTPCPDTPCSTQVKLTCDCGNRSASVPCAEDSYSRVSTALLAARLQEEPINLSELGKSGKKLECNDECYKQIRNASLAEALQINNPELRSSVVPRYSDVLKDWVRRDPALCANVHAKLADLVKLAHESKHKSRSFSFPNMNRDKRAMVHEYAQHFGITTQSFDAEPQRNVIATAARDKCSLPTVSLLEAAGSARQRRPAQSTSNTGSGAGGGVTFTDLSKKKTEEVVDWFG